MAEPGKGKGMGLLIGIGPKPELGGEPPMGEEPVDPDVEGRSMAAAALRRAIQGEDDEAIFDALRSCLDYLDMEEDEPLEEPTDDMAMPDSMMEA
jgi:hypothetical protein